MPIDNMTVPIHLGLGGSARPVEGFAWSEQQLAAYVRDTEADGPDGRMVMMFHMSGARSMWERHSLGAEVLIACTGRHRFVQELGGAEHIEEMGAGEALISSPGSGTPPTASSPVGW